MFKPIANERKTSLDAVSTACNIGRGDLTLGPGMCRRGLKKVGYIHSFQNAKIPALILVESKVKYTTRNLGNNSGKKIPIEKQMDAMIAVKTRDCDCIRAIMEKRF